MKRFLLVLVIVNFFAIGCFAQTTLIEGRVAGGDGKPLPDAYVSIPFKGLTALTDRNGKFQVSGKLEGSITIRISYSGYKTNEN